MAELIKSLAEQSFTYAYKICKDFGRDGGHSDHIWVAIAMSRYGEMIADTCVKLAMKHSITSNDLAEIIANEIKDTFPIGDIKND